MIKQSLRFSLTFLVLFCCAYGGSGRAFLPQATPIQEDAELWASQNYVKVIDAVLPNEDVESDKFPENIRWIAGVRIVPSRESSEFKFTLHRFYDGRVSAFISKPKNAPIKTQLRELKRENPSDTVERIIKRVVIQHWTLTNEKCPQLKQLVKRFDSLRISPVLNDELMVDAVSYVVWSQAQWGDQVQLRLHGPGPSAQRQPYALIQWVEDFRSASKACIGNLDK